MAFPQKRLRRRGVRSVAYGLTDSPLGWLAWIAEKFQAWTDNGGDFITVVNRDAFFTNLTLYWATGTVGSSLRIYREQHLAGGDSTSMPTTRNAGRPRRLSEGGNRLAVSLGGQALQHRPKGLKCRREGTLPLSSNPIFDQGHTNVLCEA